MRKTIAIEFIKLLLTAALCITTLAVMKSCDKEEDIDINTPIEEFYMK